MRRSSLKLLALFLLIAALVQPRPHSPPPEISVSAVSAADYTLPSLSKAIEVERWNEAVWLLAIAERQQVEGNIGAQRQQAARSGGSHRGYATAKECVRAVENGGDYGRSSNPTHFGRDQWSYETWVAYGGNPDTWGTATPAEQDEVFERAWNSPGGPDNWLPYDGCG